MYFASRHENRASLGPCISRKVWYNTGRKSPVLLLSAIFSPCHGSAMDDRKNSEAQYQQYGDFKPAQLELQIQDPKCSALADCLRGE